MRHTPRASLALSVLVVPVVLVAPVAALPGTTAALAPVPASLHTVALQAPVAPTGGLRTVARGAVVALPARDTAAFSTLGVTWRHASGAPDLEVEVRTRTHGAWTGWQDLHGESDDAPDPGSADAVSTAGTALRDGTRPVYVGASDGVQVRVDVTSGPVPADLRVDLIDPGTAPADARRAAPRDAAEAAEPQPGIVTRAEWGADESMKTCFAGYTGAPKVAFVHHTDSTNNYSPEEAPAAVRGFYAYHVKSNGWCDIAYNYLVDRYGVIYEGRAGGIDKTPLGAHTGGFNTDSFGTAMIGNFSTVAPPQVLRDSLARLIAWKLGRAYADPTGSATLTAAGSGSRFPAGTTHTFSVISGHRDAVSTSCPGDVGYTILGQLRADVRAAMGAGFVTPSASPLSPTVGGAPVVVGAGLLQPLAWRLDVTSGTTGALVRSLSGTGDFRVDTSWDLRDAAGVPVPAGAYALTLSGGPGDAPATPWSTTVRVQAPAGATPSPTASAPATAVPSESASPSAAASVSAAPAPTRTAAAPVATRAASPSPSASTGSSYVSLSPVRVLDTRDGTGGRTTPIGPGETYDLHLAGRDGVPADATAVALNLTATHPTAGTHVTVWPAGQPRPETAVLNLRPRTTAASLVVAGLGTGGSASVYSLAGTVDLVADVVGYWTRSTAVAGSRYHPVLPARLLDTRTPEGGARRLADQEQQTLAVRGHGGVPASATAVVLNVTAVGPQASGFLTVTPGGTRSGTSSVNYAAGQTVPNRVITGLSADGSIDLFAAGSTHALVDVVGWFGPASAPGGSSFTAVPPARLVDSRDGTGTPQGAFGPKTTRDVQATGHFGVPAGATALVVSLTGTGPTASQTFVAAFPDGTSLPGTSDLNLVRGETRSNLAVVPLSSAGKLSLYNEGGTTHVIADVLGYYSAG